MTFDELDLYLAVHRVYQRLESQGQEPASDGWIRRRSDEAYILVLQQIVVDRSHTDQGIRWSKDRVLDAWTHLRKGTKTRLTCDVAIAFGRRCFYAGRGLGECSLDINVDRIVAGSRGGTYDLKNCLVVCSNHNQSRQDLPIEEFLRRQWDYHGEVAR
jgi:hypothetical protein